MSSETSSIHVGKIETHEEFERISSETKKPFGIKFSAKWCGPCKIFYPKWLKYIEKYGNEIDFYEVDVDENERTALWCNAHSIPTICYFKPNGKFWWINKTPNNYENLIEETDKKLESLKIEFPEM